MFFGVCACFWCCDCSVLWWNAGLPCVVFVGWVCCVVLLCVALCCSVLCWAVGRCGALCRVLLSAAVLCCVGRLLCVWFVAVLLFVCFCCSRSCFSVLAETARQTSCSVNDFILFAHFSVLGPLGQGQTVGLNLALTGHLTPVCPNPNPGQCCVRPVLCAQTRTPSTPSRGPMVWE